MGEPRRGIDSLVHIILLSAFLVFMGCHKTDKEELNHRLIEAAKRGTPREIEILLDAGADVETKNQSGRTVLMLAALTGRKDNTETLLAHGAKINEVDGSKMTALMWAAFGGSEHTVKVLLGGGANKQLCDSHGETALDWAKSRKENSAVVRLLSAP